MDLPEDADTQSWRDHVDRRLNSQDSMLHGIDTKLNEHIAFAKAGFEKTQPVVEAMDGMRSGIRAIGWFGTAAKWMGVVAAAGSAIWIAFYQFTHGGSLPK